MEIEKPTLVTKPYLPNIERYIKYVNHAYQLEWLTNRGQLVQTLETRITEYLGLEAVPILMNNGTIPLQLAVKLLPRGSEIITTPFSYVATASSILWEGAKPVFVDIEEAFLTIDPNNIERAITDDTKAILATHVFGNPCAIEEIATIATRYNLLVVYDAAHAFAVKYKNKSIFSYGDVSTCSFHATKIFHTGEGGAAFINDPSLYEPIFQSHNFGHDGPFNYARVGINGKMSELNAAMGHAVLDDFGAILARRKAICEYYDNNLQFSDALSTLHLREGTDWNYSYYPVLFTDPTAMQRVIASLNENDIYPRRYFYPSLNTIHFFEPKTTMPVSEYIAERILCLPIFFDLEQKIQDQIINTINKEL